MVRNDDRNLDRVGLSGSGLALLQTFFDAASRAVVGFALVNQNLQFVAINETLAEINGPSVGQHLGHTIQEILPDLAPVVLPLYAQVFKTRLPLSNIEVSGEVPSRPGQRRHWLVSYVPVEPADQQLYVGSIVVEITEQKQLILQLKQLNQDLNRSNQDLEQFARTASHDLQEPLRTISSYAQLLEHRYGHQLEERGRRYLRHIFTSARRSQHLVRDLLTYARLDSRGMNPVAVDLNELLAEVLDCFQAQIASTQAQISQGPLPTITADRGQMLQVLQNLLSNALKFHRPDVPPQIQISAQRLPQYWQISVQDQGIGIDPQYRDRIFAVFQRLHLPEEFEGTGIGLSICQKIVEQHRGKIWVESVPEQGATMHFTLPIDPPG